MLGFFSLVGGFWGGLVWFGLVWFFLSFQWLLFLTKDMRFFHISAEN